eukprot:gene1808-1096_t
MTSIVSAPPLSEAANLDDHDCTPSHAADLVHHPVFEDQNLWYSTNLRSLYSNHAAHDASEDDGANDDLDGAPPASALRLERSSSDEDKNEVDSGTGGKQTLSYHSNNRNNTYDDADTDDVPAAAAELADSTSCMTHKADSGPRGVHLTVPLGAPSTAARAAAPSLGIRQPLSRLAETVRQQQQRSSNANVNHSPAGADGERPRPRSVSPPLPQQGHLAAKWSGAGGAAVAANTAASAVATKKKTVTVFDPEFKVQWTVPTDAVVHYPPARMNITRLVQCRNYRMREPNSCAMGLKCKFVHIDIDCSKLPSTPVHINYVWRSERECLYRRLPPGPFDTRDGSPLQRTAEELAALERKQAEKLQRRIQRRQRRFQQANERVLLTSITRDVEEMQMTEDVLGAADGPFDSSMTTRAVDEQMRHQVHRIPDEDLDSASDADDIDDVHIVELITVDKDKLEVRQDCLLITSGSLALDDAEGPLQVCEEYHKAAMCSSGERCSFVHPVVVDCNFRDEFKRVSKRCRLVSDRHHRVIMIPEPSSAKTNNNNNNTTTNNNTNGSTNNGTSNSNGNHHNSSNNRNGFGSQSMSAYSREDRQAQAQQSGGMNGWMVSEGGRSSQPPPSSKFHFDPRRSGGAGAGYVGGGLYGPPPRGPADAEPYHPMGRPWRGAGYTAMDTAALSGYYNPAAGRLPSGVGRGRGSGSAAAAFYGGRYGAGGVPPNPYVGAAGRGGAMMTGAARSPASRAAGGGGFQLSPDAASAVGEVGAAAAAQYLQMHPAASSAEVMAVAAEAGASVAAAYWQSLGGLSAAAQKNNGPSAAAEPFYPAGAGAGAGAGGMLSAEAVAVAQAAVEMFYAQQAAAGGAVPGLSGAPSPSPSPAVLAALRILHEQGLAATAASSGVLDDESPFMWDNSADPGMAAAAAAMAAVDSSATGLEGGVGSANSYGMTMGFDSAPYFPPSAGGWANEAAGFAMWLEKQTNKQTNKKTTNKQKKRCTISEARIEAEESAVQKRSAPLMDRKKTNKAMKVVVATEKEIQMKLNWTLSTDIHIHACTHAPPNLIPEQMTRWCAAELDVEPNEFSPIVPRQHDTTLHTELEVLPIHLSSIVVPNETPNFFSFDHLLLLPFSLSLSLAFACHGQPPGTDVRDNRSALALTLDRSVGNCCTSLKADLIVMFATPDMSILVETMESSPSIGAAENGLFKETQSLNLPTHETTVLKFSEPLIINSCFAATPASSQLLPASPLMGLNPMIGVASRRAFTSPPTVAPDSVRALSTAPGVGYSLPQPSLNSTPKTSELNLSEKLLTPLSEDSLRSLQHWAQHLADPHHLLENQHNLDLIHTHTYIHTHTHTQRCWGNIIIIIIIFFFFIIIPPRHCWGLSFAGGFPPSHPLRRSRLPMSLAFDSTPTQTSERLAGLSVSPLQEVPEDLLCARHHSATHTPSPRRVPSPKEVEYHHHHHQEEEEQEEEEEEPNRRTHQAGKAGDRSGEAEPIRRHRRTSRSPVHRAAPAAVDLSFRSPARSPRAVDPCRSPVQSGATLTAPLTDMARSRAATTASAAAAAAAATSLRHSCQKGGASASSSRSRVSSSDAGGETGRRGSWRTPGYKAAEAPEEKKKAWRPPVQDEEQQSSTRKEMSGTTVAEAVVQRRIMEQQCQHALQELERTRTAYQAAVRSTKDLSQELQAHKTEATTLRQRYAAVLERLGGTESSLSGVEEALVQERQRSQLLRHDVDEERRKASALRVERDALHRRVQELTAEASSLGEEQAALQALLRDRTRFVPTMEARREMEEQKAQQRLSVIQPLQQLLQALSLSADAAETKAVIARSNVLEAARQLEDEVAHTEATVVALREYYGTYHAQLEAETTVFMDRVVAENTSLYAELGEVQQRYSVAKAEVAQRLPRGEAVPMAVHREALEQQADLYTGRLGKAQELLKSQTMLIRQHEDVMAEMLRHQEELRERLAQMEAAYQDVVAQKEAETAALAAAKSSLSRSESAAAELKAALEAEREERRTAFVPRQEKELLESSAAEFEAAYAAQRRATERLEEDKATLEQQLAEANAEVARLEDELTHQQAAQAAQQERWAGELQAQEQEHQAAAARLQKEFAQQVQGLEKELEAQRAAQETAHTRLAELQAAAEDAAVELAAARNNSQLLLDERDTLQQRLDQLRTAQLEPLQAAHDTLQTAFREAQKELTGTRQQCAALESSVAAQRTSDQQTVASLRHQLSHATAQWEAAEAARLELQQQLSAALCRVKDLELEMDGDRVAGLDRSTLLKENARLEAALQAYVSEAGERYKSSEQQRAHERVQEELRTQIAELQAQLAALAPLQGAVRALEAESRAAQTEVAGLLRERDAMAAHIKQLLRRREEAAKLDSELERVLSDAGAATQRLHACSAIRATLAQSSPPANSAGAALTPRRSAPTSAALLLCSGDAAPATTPATASSTETTARMMVALPQHSYAYQQRGVAARATAGLSSRSAAATPKKEDGRQHAERAAPPSCGPTLPLEKRRENLMEPEGVPASGTASPHSSAGVCGGSSSAHEPHERGRLGSTSPLPSSPNAPASGRRHPPPLFFPTLTNRKPTNQQEIYVYPHLRQDKLYLSLLLTTLSFSPSPLFLFFFFLFFFFFPASYISFVSDS